MTFTPSGTGSPAMSLLDGVSIVAVPEPAEWMLMSAGFGLIVLLRLRSRRRQQR